MRRHLSYFVICDVTGPNQHIVLFFFFFYFGGYHKQNLTTFTCTQPIFLFRASKEKLGQRETLWVEVSLLWTGLSQAYLIYCCVLCLGSMLIHTFHKKSSQSLSTSWSFCPGWPRRGGIGWWERWKGKRSLLHNLKLFQTFFPYKEPHKSQSLYIFTKTCRIWMRRFKHLACGGIKAQWFRAENIITCWS